MSSTAAAMEEWISGADKKAPLDLVIANAGRLRQHAARHGEIREDAAMIFDTNIDGVLEHRLPGVAGERSRGGVARSPSWHRSRPIAACRARRPMTPRRRRCWAPVNRPGGAILRRGASALSVIMPGFIKSQMTASNKFPMPFLMNADRTKMGLGSGRFGASPLNLRCAFLDSTTTGDNNDLRQLSRPGLPGATSCAPRPPASRHCPLGATPSRLWPKKPVTMIVPLPGRRRHGRVRPAPCPPSSPLS